MFLISSCSFLCPIHWNKPCVKSAIGAARTTPEWSTILLPTNVPLVSVRCFNSHLIQIHFTDYRKYANVVIRSRNHAVFLFYALKCITIFGLYNGSVPIRQLSHYLIIFKPLALMMVLGIMIELLSEMIYFNSRQLQLRSKRILLEWRRVNCVGKSYYMAIGVSTLMMS